MRGHVPSASPRRASLSGKIRLGPAIVGGRLQYLSVTAIDRFAGDWGCPRAWGFHTIDKVRPVEDTTARDAGVAVHDEIDAFQTTGADRLGPIARAGRHLYYPPGPGILVEHESLGEVSVSGVPFYVRLDLLNARDYWLDDDGERRELSGAVEVLDWKTTGDVAKRALSARGLLGTVQMPVYALWSRTRYERTHVRLSHAYLGTKRPEALKVSGLFTRAEVDGRIEAIGRIVERMKEAALAPTGADLEPDLTKCNKSRAGCAFQSICPRAQFSGLYALTTREQGPKLPLSGSTTADGGSPMASVLDRLKMKAPAGDPAPSTPPVVGTVAPAPAPAPTPDPDAVAKRVAELEAQLAAAKAGANVTLTGEAAKAVVPDLPVGAAVITSAATAEKALAGIAPPDVPASGTTAPAADPVPAEALATMPAEIQAAAAAVAAEHAAAQVGSKDGGIIISATAEAPAPEPPAKKARKSKDAKTPPGGIGTSPSFPGLLVLVDAVVSGAEPDSLDAYFDAMVARMCEKDGIADVRMAPKDSFLAYGQWRPIINMMVKAEPPAPGLYSFRVGGDDVRLAFAWALQSVPGAVVAWGVK